MLAGKYLYAPDPHFVSATDTSRRAPSEPNKHFVILRPGDSFTTTVKTGVLADSAPGSTLMRDTYVARIGVDTSPDWVFSKDQEQKWKRYGRFTQDPVWSEPFELKISFPDNAHKCK